jgi:hypothetical protein
MRVRQPPQANQLVDLLQQMHDLAELGAEASTQIARLIAAGRSDDALDLIGQFRVQLAVGPPYGTKPN